MRRIIVIGINLLGIAFDMLLPFLLWQELGFLEQDDNSPASKFAHSRPYF